MCDQKKAAHIPMNVDANTRAIINALAKAERVLVIWKSSTKLKRFYFQAPEEPSAIYHTVVTEENVDGKREGKPCDAKSGRAFQAYFERYDVVVYHEELFKENQTPAIDMDTKKVLHIWGADVNKTWYEKYLCALATTENCTEEEFETAMHVKRYADTLYPGHGIKVMRADENEETYYYGPTFVGLIANLAKFAKMLQQRVPGFVKAEVTDTGIQDQYFKNGIWKKMQFQHADGREKKLPNFLSYSQHKHAWMLNSWTHQSDTTHFYEDEEGPFEGTLDNMPTFLTRVNKAMGGSALDNMALPRVDKAMGGSASRLQADQFMGKSIQAMQRYKRALNEMTPETKRHCWSGPQHALKRHGDFTNETVAVYDSRSDLCVSERENWENWEIAQLRAGKEATLEKYELYRKQQKESKAAGEGPEIAKTASISLTELTPSLAMHEELKPIGRAKADSVEEMKNKADTIADAVMIED